MFGYFVLLVALSISAVAAYYSIIGLTAIFAAAFIPIVIMGSVLEVAKITTAVWLHRYWDIAPKLMRIYLTVATIVLMFITSMGIFGYLSKAHIEQTSRSQEGVAQLERIDAEIARNNAIIARAEQQVVKAENSAGTRNAGIQQQIEAEQDRISKAYQRVQPAINEQQKIIDRESSRDANRTKPFEDQLASLKEEIIRLEKSAKDYETSITKLEVDSSNVKPLLDQVAAIEQEIIRVTNQINSKEQQQVRSAQAIIGVTSDGFFGNNTREALVKWVNAQRERITQIQGQVVVVRREAQKAVDNERNRIAGIIKDIRTVQIPAVKKREADMLVKIDQVRASESPVIKNARVEIARIRQGVEQQIADSNKLVADLRSKIQIDNGADTESLIAEQQAKIKQANVDIDQLIEKKYKIEAEARKLEAEVGPVKYIAELVYGNNADTSLLEQAVRWVILLLVSVFDPLAVILVLAGVMTINSFHKSRKQHTVDPVFVNKPKEPTINTEVAETPAEKSDPFNPGWMYTGFQENSVEAVKEPAPQISPEPKKKTKKITTKKVAKQEAPYVQQLEPSGDVDQLVGTGRYENDLQGSEDASSSSMDTIGDSQPRKSLSAKDTRVPETRDPGKKRQLKVVETFDINKTSDGLSETGFGGAFPASPEKGTQFVRTDLIPTRLYKFNGYKWMEISKLTTDTYAHNTKYIDFLITKLNSKEYDPEDLSTAEREEIERRIKTTF